MQSRAQSSNVPPHPPFDASAWLDQFNRAGGYLHRLPDGRLSAGWHLQGHTPAQNQAACAAWRTIATDAARLDAVSNQVAALLFSPPVVAA